MAMAVDVQLRPLEQPGDLERLAAVANASFAADGIARHQEAADLARWWQRATERFDPAQDVVVAVAGDQPIAFGVGGWEADTDGGRNHDTFCVVAPAWRRRGVGTRLQAWLEERHRALAAIQPADVERRLQAWTDDRQEGLRALLEGRGYRAIRGWLEMDRASLENLPEATLPPGLEFRPARPELMRTYWQTDVEAFRDHFGEINDTEAAFEWKRDHPHNALATWAVVHHGDEVVGLASNRINRAANEQLGVERGWIIGVGVLRPWRRKGVGRAIVAESLRLLREAGMTTARLGVDADNPYGAVRLYEELGFEISARGSIYRKPLEDHR